MGGGYFLSLSHLSLLLVRKSLAKKTIIEIVCVFLNGPTHDKKLSLNKTSNFHFESLVKEFLGGVSVTS